MDVVVLDPDGVGIIVTPAAIVHTPTPMFIAPLPLVLPVGHGNGKIKGDYRGNGGLRDTSTPIIFM